MNLRDKLRNAAPADTGDLEESWSPAAEEAPEPPKKKAKAAAAPAKGKGKQPERKSLLGGLDVNRRFLLIAACVAGMTALLAVNYLSSAGSGLEAGGTKVTVVVPAQDLPAGARLTEDKLTTKEVPKAYLSKGYFEDVEKLKGRLAIAPMVEGEPILEVRTSTPNAKYGIAYLLKPGERAKTVSVDSASGIAGLIKPGNEVDLFATIPDPSDSNRRISTPVIQQARVIAVGDQLLGEVRPAPEDGEESGRNNPQSGIEYQGTVTLAVPSGKTALVTLLEDLGKLNMVLRAEGDDSVLKARYSDDMVMALVSGKVPPKEAPKPVVKPAYVPPAQPRPVIKEVVRHDPPPRPVVRRDPPPQPKPVAPKPQPHHVEVIQFGK